MSQGIRTLAVVAGMALALLASAAVPPVSDSSTVRANGGETRGSVPVQAALESKALEPSGTECGDGAALLDSYQNLYRAPDSSQRAFSFLVALVPDPEESGHTDYFDSVLEGVEDAVAAGSSHWWKEPAAPLRRYVRDRHWFPWAGKDARKRERHCWETEPGVLIYRPLDDPRAEPALAVLLVGETPTWGIREQQLFTALDWIDARRVRRRVSMARSAPLVNHYRILGPTFSGSADSLAAAIHQRASARGPAFDVPALQFRVASGTAMAPGVGSSLLAENAQRVVIKYQSATATSVALVEAIRHFLGDSAGRVALLHEAATRYGESVGVPRAGNDQCAPTALGPTPASEVILYAFPPNLASIRRAYTDLGPQAKPAGNRAPSQAHAAPEEERGELSEQTPITHDLALAELLRNFGRCQIRYVGLVATDARDVIFMAERIKRQLPDVRLFTLGMDLRYLHPEHAEALNGMLVAHAVQLGPLDRDSTVLQVPMTRNVSAAGRALLTGTEPDYEVRVSLIGNGQLWEMEEPAAAETEEEPSDTEATPLISVARATTHLRPLDQVRRAARGAAWVPPPGFWLVLVVSVLLYLVASCVLLPRWLPVVRLRAWLGRPERSDDAAFQYPDIAADDAFAAAALVGVLASIPVLLLAALHCRSGDTRYLTCVGVLELPALAAWAEALRHWRLASRSAIITSAFTAAGAVLSASIGCGTARDATFHLLSGGSPLIGGLVGLCLLVVAIYCWRLRLCYLQALRFGPSQADSRFCADGQPITLALGEKAGSAIDIREQRLLWLLRHPWRYVPRGLCLTATVLVLVLFVGMSPLTFERAWHHWFLVVFSLACFVPAAFSSVRIVVTAAAIRSVSRDVASSTIMPALARLPDALARPLNSQFVLTDCAADELKAAVTALGALARDAAVPIDTYRECERLLSEELVYEVGHVKSPPDVRRGRAAGILSKELLRIAGTLQAAPPASASPDKPADPGSVQRAQLVDNYRATLVAAFVGRYLRQISLAAPPVLAGTLSLVLMTTLYFVQPQRLITTVAFFWFFAVGVSLAAAYLALVHDPVIRAIGRTSNSSALTWGTLARTATVVVVPLLGILAAQYPELPLRINSALTLFTHTLQ
ncbi:MAG: hypothetical protein ABI895_03345 [Deltaproteobacteria bacterium]